MAGRPRKFTKELTTDERTMLETIAHSRTEEKRRVERAEVILGCAAGMSNVAIAEKLHISKPTVVKILKKWTMFGVNSALEDLQRTGRPAKIRIEAKAWVISLACTKPEDIPGAPMTLQWTISALTKYVRSNCLKQQLPELEGVQESTVWSILNERDIKPHRMSYYLVRKDPEFKVKAEKVLLLYKRVEWILQMTRQEVAAESRPDELCGEVFVSYDEKPGIQAIGNIAPDKAPTLQHGYVSRDYEYRRLGTVSLLAGIDLLTGEVTGLVRDSHKSDDFIDFLKELDSKYDEQLKINIILDNHSVHRSKTVMDYLATKRKDRFVFTFTPTHASWLNLVESFFSKLAKQALRGLRVKSKADLVTRIEEWLKRTNEERVVYRWKWKLEDIESAFTG